MLCFQSKKSNSFICIVLSITSGLQIKNSGLKAKKQETILEWFSGLEKGHL